jgi:hypothetical protein
MTDIPDNFVFREIECQMKGHGQLDGTQIAGEMAACDADFFKQKLPDLLRETTVLFRGYFLYIIGMLYFFNECQRSESSACVLIDPGR